MAANTELNILVRLKDEASASLAKVGAGLGSFKSKIEDMQPTFQRMAIGGTAALTAMSVGIYKSVQAANEAEVVQTRLAQILKTTVNATEQQIQALNDQAEALEKVGVVSADVIRQGQGQLASFDLQTESIKKLIPSILNYAVAEKGLNMTTQDLQAVTNGLAQALQGKFRSLEATGFVLDEETKAMISNGTEAERVAALTKVLDSTYAGLNERMRETTAGGMLGMQFALDKLKETIGSALTPVIIVLTEQLTPVLEKLARFAEENPKLVATILMVAAGIAALIAVLGTIGLILPTVITGVQMLGTALIFLTTNPIGLVILAIGALITLAVLLIKNWDQVRAFLISAWNSIAATAKSVWAGIRDTIAGAINSARDAVSAAVDWIESKLRAVGNAINSVKQKAQSIGGSIGGFIDRFTPFAEGGIVTRPTLGLVGEAGPEAIIPLNKMAGLGGITINITGNNIWNEDDAERIGDMLVRKLKLHEKL